MVAVRVTITRTFASWDCECGRVFRFPGGRFPQTAVNDHFENDCFILNRHMAGFGTYHYGLAYDLVRPTINLDSEEAWKWDEPRVRV